MPSTPLADYGRSRDERSYPSHARPYERKRQRDDDIEPGEYRTSRERGASREPGNKRRETSSERRERKAAKAEKKLRQKAEEETQRAQAAEFNYYSATDNPFHDANLDQQFVWGKKRDRDKKAGLTVEDSQVRDAARRADAKDELERLNRRRAEREIEMEQRAADEARMQRDQESAQMSQWIAREDQFFLEQARKRAEIRVRERRAKPIDFLALNLKWSLPQPDLEEDDEGEGLDADLEEPYKIFDELTLEETQELDLDINMYLSLERNEDHLDFWRSMLLVCRSALDNLRQQRTLGFAQYAEQARQSAGVKAEIATLLRGKTVEQLSGLETSVLRKLRSNEPIDTEYWENLLKELIVWKAKSKLRDMHEIVLRNRLEQLRRRQRDEAVNAQNELARDMPSNFANAVKVEEEVDALPDEVVVEERVPYEPGMSPEPIARLAPDERHLEMLLEADEREKLVAARRIVASQRFVPKKRQPAPAGPSIDQIAQQRFIEADQDDAEGQELGEEEELFELEEEMNRQSYLWEDKYRPRKPRYYNKVLTGFEWNKYNQTHYDGDNPPPKVVQGYKFNIFLPDLIDKTKAPTFEIKRESDNADTALLVFKCGPPYEDLAFRIVNREWEYSHKRGFKCTFDRGVLQLYVNLRRMQYRK